MSLLDEIISGAIDDSVSTSNLLRRVQIVAHRLGAEEIADWVKNELNGYPTIDSLPQYRESLSTPVIGTWAGYAGSSATLPLGVGSIPDDAAEVLFRMNLTQSIAELEQLASLDEDPGQAWDPTYVVMYGRWVDKGKAPGMSGMNLISARKVLTKGSIAGVIDASRNTALDFALQLQTTDPLAGALDGPTMDDPAVARTVFNITNNITGHGTNIAAGENIQQRSGVRAGDLESLLSAVKVLGLGDDGCRELASALLAAEDQRPKKIQSFLTKLSDGAFQITTGVAGNMIAGQLGPLIATFLGQ